MKKCLLAIFLIIICFITTNVYAECSYAEIVEVNTDASYVNAGYSFAYDANGAVGGFELTIYNLTQNMYVKLDIMEETPNITDIDYKPHQETRLITYADTTLGVFNLQTTELNKIWKYSFNVYSLSSYTGCSKKLKTINVTKPRKNSYSELDICKHRELANYFYCKKWSTQEFNKEPTEVEMAIRQRLKDTQKKTTTLGRSSLNKAARDEAYLRLKIIYISSAVSIICMIVILICTVRISINNRNVI